MNSENSKCFSFYSYKGGSGRTTTLVNVAKHLAEKLNASKKHPLLLIDADLESAGLTYFFNCEKRFTAKINCTLHAESFLNRSKEVLSGVIGDNTFGKSRERLVLCENIAKRIADLYPNYSIESVFDNICIRDTTFQILERIVIAAERCSSVKDNADPENNSVDSFLFKTYRLDELIGKLISIEKNNSNNVPEKKRKAIEAFLPTDGMVDVSEYFGLSEGSIMFIGVDVAFTGEHSTLSNEWALANKRHIVKECSKNGFSAILFDCGAGVQSTAHVLNHISDVIVYCMRPTYQFVSGTRNQLINYQHCLTQNVNIKKLKADENGDSCDKKAVILLPTAVPYETNDTNELQDDSFNRIKNIAGLWSSFVDDTFCSYKMALKEVSLFKWREHILGTKAVDTEQTSPESLKKLEIYSEYNRMPEDAQAAYDTYKHIAERLIYNA